MLAALSAVPILSLVSAVVTAGIVLFLWQHSEKPGAKTFVVVMVGASIWSGGYAMTLFAYDPAMSRGFETIAWIGRLMMPMAWLLFALQYTGRGEVITKPLAAFLGINPGLTIGVLATADAHELMWRNYHVVEVAGTAVGTYGYGPWLVWQTVYGYALIGLGLLILLEMLYSQGRLYRGQALALIVAAAIPSATNAIWLFDVGPVPSLDLTPTVFSVSGVMFIYALFTQDLFQLVPATRREGKQVALDFFGDGIVVIDDEHRIIDVNDAAERILHCEADSVLGEPIDAVVADASFDLTANEGLLSIEGQQYELTATPIRDGGDRLLGRTLMFHDVTERVRRKQLLSVLNRVLRHNLRNDMMVVQGYAELLERRVEGSSAEFASLIDERSAKLLELADKARDLERLITEEEWQREQIALGECIRSVGRSVQASYPWGSLTIDVPDGLRMEADSGVIESVIENVVQNAFEHNDAERPEVSVHALRTDDGLSIVVADNGPGIPAPELAILTAEEETPLEHGTGLGLWLVSWGVDALGGVVRFEENDPRGTVVRIDLPETRAEPNVFESLVA